MWWFQETHSILAKSLKIRIIRIENKTEIKECVYSWLSCVCRLVPSLFLVSLRSKRSSWRSICRFRCPYCLTSSRACKTIDAGAYFRLWFSSSVGRRTRDTGRLHEESWLQEINEILKCPRCINTGQIFVESCKNWECLRWWTCIKRVIEWLQ